MIRDEFMKKILLIFLIALFMSLITACNTSKKISEEEAKQIALTRAEEIDKSLSRTYIVHEVSKGSESSKPVWMINLINVDKTSVSSSLWFYIDAKTGKILMVNGY